MCIRDRCLSCGDKKRTIGEEQAEKVSQTVLKPKFQSIIDAAEVEGVILVYDLKKDIYYSNDFQLSKKGFLPASTFKIANSIIGLETGVIESDSTIFQWDGLKKGIKNWEQDLVLKDAFQFSCVPCYQKVARNIGAKKMNEYINKLNYGSLKIDSTNIDKFWLEGASRISPIQQIDFIKRFYEHQIPINERTDKILRNIMLIKKTDKYWLSGKTGLSITNQKYNGWFVGYLESNDNTYIFATNLKPKTGFDFNEFIDKRLNLTISAFKIINVLNY